MNRRKDRSVTPDKNESPSRYPKYPEVKKCAYHPKQIITNFCKCEECLLPVCPTCIKLHTDEHKDKHTNPKFEQINKVIEEIQDTYSRLDEMIGEVKRLLIDIEGEKKENEGKIRQKLIEHRNVLMKEFEKSLIEMQNKIIGEIVKDDKEFIESMETMDEQLAKIQKSNTKNIQNLRSGDLLKHIIIFHSKKNNEKYRRELQQIKTKGIALTRKQILVTVDDMEIDNIAKAVSRYMHIEIAEGGSSSRSSVSRI